MASVPIGGERATVTRFPAVPPMPAVARILSRYDRSTLEAFLSVAIDLLDTLDGPSDPDAPDFRLCSDGAPGDPQDSEPAGDEGDWAWPEWDRRNLAGRRAGVEADALTNCGLSEDDEEDDPHGVCDEDGANTALCLLRGRGPGCLISDSDREDGE